MGIIWMIEIFGIIQILFHILLRFDKEHGLTMGNKVIILEAVLSIAGGFFIAIQRLPGFTAACLSVFIAYLITAAIIDWQTKTVHDFLHVIAVLAGGLLMLYSQPGWGVARDYIIFLLIQLIIFRKMYGGADSITFCVCALFQAAVGRVLLDYVLHMGATFLILICVQASRRNFNRKGNLKEPVALVPYIAATAWLFLF